MALVRHLFTTEAEAEAFRVGVEYVNDDAIEVVDIARTVVPPDAWAAVIDDSDGDEDYTADHRPAPDPRPCSCGHPVREHQVGEGPWTGFCADVDCKCERPTPVEAAA